MRRQNMIWMLLALQLVLLVGAVIVYFATDQALVALALAVVALLISLGGGFLSRPSATTEDEPVPPARQIAAYRRKHPEASLGEAIDALREQR